METQGPEYLEHLKNKYHLGRSLYLTTLVYPRYLKEISPGDVWDFGCGLGEFLSYCKKEAGRLMALILILILSRRAGRED